MTRDAVLKGHSGQHEEVEEEGAGRGGGFFLSFPPASLGQPWETHLMPTPSFF